VSTSERKVETQSTKQGNSQYLSNGDVIIIIMRRRRRRKWRKWENTERRA
jgi:hypothetical protein